MVTSYSIPQAIQAAHWWKFKQPLSYHFALDHTADLMRHNIMPPFVAEWLRYVRTTTTPEERAAVIVYLLSRLEDSP